MKTAAGYTSGVLLEYHYPTGRIEASIQNAIRDFTTIVDRALYCPFPLFEEIRPRDLEFHSRILKAYLYMVEEMYGIWFLRLIS